MWNLARLIGNQKRYYSGNRLFSGVDSDWLRFGKQIINIEVYCKSSIFTFFETLIFDVIWVVKISWKYLVTKCQYLTWNAIVQSIYCQYILSRQYLSVSLLHQLPLQNYYCSHWNNHRFLSNRFCLYSDHCWYVLVLCKLLHRALGELLDKKSNYLRCEVCLWFHLTE